MQTDAETAPRDKGDAFTTKKKNKKSNSLSRTNCLDERNWKTPSCHRPPTEEDDDNDIEWEGSGLPQNPVDALIDRTDVAPGSIKAENASLNFKKEALELLKLLHN